jgi:hypothetical protein
VKSLGLRIDNMHVARASFDRPNLSFIFIQRPAAGGFGCILPVLQKYAPTGEVKQFMLFLLFCFFIKTEQTALHHLRAKAKAVRSNSKLSERSKAFLCYVSRQNASCGATEGASDLCFGTSKHSRRNHCVRDGNRVRHVGIIWCVFYLWSFLAVILRFVLFFILV